MRSSAFVVITCRQRLSLLSISPFLYPVHTRDTLVGRENQIPGTLVKTKNFPIAEVYWVPAVRDAHSHLQVSRWVPLCVCLLTLGRHAYTHRRGNCGAYYVCPTITTLMLWLYTIVMCVFQTYGDGVEARYHC